MSLDQRKGEPIQGGEVFGTVILVDAATVFAKSYIQYPMLGVLDFPEVSDELPTSAGTWDDSKRRQSQIRPFPRRLYPCPQSHPWFPSLLHRIAVFIPIVPF